jgi:hypothetical protein
VVGVAVLAALWVAVPAQASTVGYARAGAFEGAAFATYSGVAVDDATGDVLVVQPNLPGVRLYGPGGTDAPLLMTFGEDHPYSWVAVDQGDGDVYVSRSSQDEHQYLHFLNATGGTYTLTYKGQTTAPIPYGVEISAIGSALEALPTVPSDSIRLASAFFFPLSGATEIIFEGPLGETDVEQVTIDGSGLEGESVDVGAETFTAGRPGGIAKFIPDDRLHPTTYSDDPDFTGPVRGTDAETGQVGLLRSPITVDPRNGDLLIADVLNRQVMRFAPDGTFLDSFDGSGSPGGPFSSLRDITVAPDGGVYLIRDRAGVAGSTVERFDPSGGGGTPIGGDQLGEARSVVFDPHFDHLVVGTADDPVFPSASHLDIYHDDTLVERDPFEGGVPLDLAVDGGSSRHLYAITGQVQVLSPLVTPLLGAPTGMRASGEDPATLHLSGSVDPLGRHLDYRFEYSGDEGTTWSATPTLDAGDGEGAQQVQADLQLPGADSYQLRLVVSGSGASKASAIRTIHSPPTTTLSADHYNLTAAILRGSVDPEGLPTGYHFEYGTTTAYGSKTPGLSAREGDQSLPVSQAVSDLQPGTTYHFRLVAQNVTGTRVGEDRHFTTLAAPMGLGLRPILADGPAVAGASAKGCAKGRHLRKGKGAPRCSRPKPKHRRHRGRPEHKQ